MLDLNSASASDLMRLLGPTRPTLLLGSGISLWDPTSLPTGQDFTKGVLEAVFDPSTGAPITDPSDKTVLDDLLASLPFEMLLESCPNQHTLASILSSLYGSAKPNNIHKALAAMASDGAIDCIVTTNYDLALDTALNDRCSPLSKVVIESQTPPGTAKVYFKVHGSTDLADSLVYSIRLESRLPVWKRNLLSRCIDGRPLIVIGYSGLDFEVCPEISRLSPSVILWNVFSPTDVEKPGFRYLSTHGMPPTAAVGDMSRLLDLLGYSVQPLTRSTVGTNVADLIYQHFAADQLLLWRARLLNTMGFCRLAAEALQPLRISGHPDADLEYAQTLFQLGTYQRSGRLFLDASKITTDTYERALRLLDASDAFRCFGNWALSYTCVRRANNISGVGRSAGPLVTARSAMKKLLLLQDFAGALPFGRQIVKRLGSDLVRSGAPAALEAGDWLTFQQFMLIAERWAISVSAFGHGGHYDPPPAKDGYRHLGFKIGELLNLLDRTRRAPLSVTYSELVEAFKMAALLGSHPTAWKIAALIAACFPQHASRYRRLKEQHLHRCEYSGILRWTYLRAK